MCKWKRKLAAILCLSVFITQTNPYVITYADSISVRKDLVHSQRASDSDITLSDDLSEDEWEQENATASNAKVEDEFDQSMSFQVEVSYEDVMDMDLPVREAYRLRTGEVRYYLSDALGVPSTIDSYYGKQLSGGAAAIYTITDEYFHEIANGNILGSYTKALPQKYKYDMLSDEEYNSLRDDVYNELRLYFGLVLLSYAGDHPEFDQTELTFTADVDITHSKAPGTTGLNYGDIAVTVHIELGTARANTVHQQYEQIKKELDNLSLTGSTMYEQVRELHDYLCDRVTYNLNAPHDQTAYGAIVEGEASCAGYARAFQLLCSYFNIPCVLIAGTAVTDEGQDGHMWNLVEMDNGYWYAVDTTGDDGGTGDHVYHNFLVGSETISVEGTRSFGESHIPNPQTISFGKYTSTLEIPELNTEEYLVLSDCVKIIDAALYTENENVSTKISKLDYAAGNFFNNLARDIYLDNLSSTTYEEKLYASFDVEIESDENQLIKTAEITIKLPDGLSFSADKVVSEKDFRISTYGSTERIWTEIYLLYSEKHNNAQQLDVYYEGIAFGSEKFGGQAKLIDLNVVSKTNNIPLMIENNKGVFETVNCNVWNSIIYGESPSTYFSSAALFNAYLNAMFNGSDRSSVESHLKTNLKMLGLSKVEMRYRTSDTEDEFRYLLATKKIVLHGEVRTILFYILPEDERSAYGVIGKWIFTPKGSNARISFNMEIDNRREQNFRVLTKYCQNTGIDLEDSSVKKMISGHGLGGGIANLISADLLNGENLQSIVVPQDSLYCYTFGSPNVADISEGQNNLYDGIYNFVNSRDIMPFIPGMLKKYGKNLMFHVVPGTLDDMLCMFDDMLFGIRFIMEADKKDIKYIAKASITFTLLFAVLKNKLSRMENHSMADYIDGIITTSYFDDSFDAVNERMDEMQSTWDFANEIKNNPVSPKDSMIKYRDDALTTIMNTNRKSAIHKIYCPVDVEVLDGNENVICRVVHNEIQDILADDIGVLVYGDQKEIWFDADSDYTVRIIGNNDGTMEYIINMISDQNDEQTIYHFSDVSVTKDEVVLVADQNAGMMSYSFTDKSGQEIIPDETINGSQLEEVTVQLDTNMENVLLSGPETTIKGNYTHVATTTNDERLLFTGWYDEEGNYLSDDPVYGFIAYEDTHLTAKYRYLKLVPDSNLEKAILDAGFDLDGDGVLIQSELKKIDCLDARNCNIKDLTGLEYAENLFMLLLDDNPVQDLSPLQNLPKLETLELWGSNVEDLSPLENVKSLKAINLGNAKISDLTALSSLINLEYLNLHNNQIKDISVIRNLTNLTYLYLYGNQIRSLEPLKNLVYLTELDVRDNLLTDIPDFTKLTALKLYQQNEDGSINYQDPLIIFNTNDIPCEKFIGKFAEKLTDEWLQLNSSDGYTYTIQFNGNGADSGRMDSVVDFCAYNHSVPDCEFQKQGYYFDGWNTKADGSGVFYPLGGLIPENSQKFASTLTLYAQWKKRFYTIEYQLDGGVNHPENPTIYYEDSETIILKSPTKEGYKFSGWLKIGEADGIMTEISKGSTENIYLYALWDILLPDENEGNGNNNGSSSGNGNNSSSGSGGGGSSSGGGGGGGSSSGGGGGGGSSSGGSTSGGPGGPGSAGIITTDPQKGQVNSVTGIISGEANANFGDGFSHWQTIWHQDALLGNSVSWKLVYADGTFASGSIVLDEIGNQREHVLWEMVDGAWYAFGADGFAKTNWLLDSLTGYQYYLNPQSCAMMTGWIQINGVWYYLNPTAGTKPLGALYRNEQTPDGFWTENDGSWRKESVK